MAKDYTNETRDIIARYVADPTQANHLMTIPVKDFWMEGGTVYARLPESSMVAELNLATPNHGWKIYPN